MSASSASDQPKRLIASTTRDPAAWARAMTSLIQLLFQELQADDVLTRCPSASASTAK